MNTLESALVVLSEASTIIKGRQDKHGDTRMTHRMAAELWSAILRHKLKTDITPSEVALCMSLLKHARAQHGGFNLDDYIDSCGYMSICADLRVSEAMEKTNGYVEEDA